MRAGPRLALTALVTLAALVGPTGAAGAALVWDRVNVGAVRGGLTAVAVDPADPRVVWVAGGGSVWVSDDDGDSWSLVATLRGGVRVPEAAAERTGDGAEDDEEDDVDPEDDEFWEESDDGSRQEGDTPDETDAEQDEGETGGRALPETSEEATVQAGRIERLRVIGEHVWICGSVGLWRIDKTARTLGTERQVRFGRQSPVFDVAPRKAGGLWIATASGLLSGGVNIAATPVVGGLGGGPVYALARATSGMVASAPSGLWRLTLRGWVEVGLTRPARPHSDLLARPGEEIVTVNPEAVQRVVPTAPRVVARYLVTGTSRIAVVAPSGDIWAAGSGGVWAIDATGVVHPRHDGLPGRRARDLAAPAGGKVTLWVVGSFGAARLIPEAQRIWSDRARTMAREREGMPSAWDTIRAAQRQRWVDPDVVDDNDTRAATAWMLPTVEVQYHSKLKRIEDRIGIPVLNDELILNEVFVRPAYERFTLWITWDLAPVLWARLGYDTNDWDESLTAVTSARRDIRNSVLPLYNEWVERRIELAASPATTVDQSVRDILKMQHIEADLYAATGGWFPTPTVRPPSEQLPGNATVEAEGENR